jgi:hypothetical protein
MTVTAASIEAGGTGTATGFSLATHDYVAGRLYLLTVTGFIFTYDMADVVPYITGGGWTLVRHSDHPTANDATITHRFAPSTTQTGLVVTWDADIGDNGQWAYVLDELNGADVGGTNGSNAIVQSAEASINVTAGPLEVTLAAFGSGGNATYMAEGDTGLTAPAYVGPMTDLSAGAGSSRTCRSGFYNGNDLSPALSFSNSDSNLIGHAFEIKAAVTDTTDQLRRLRRMNQAGRQAVIQRSGQW